MHVLIITPIYPPTTGGAATYYDLLTEGLLVSGEVTKITIITERVPGCHKKELKRGASLSIIRMFPYRAGRHLGCIQLYWRYAIQNLQYLLLPRLILSINPDVILIHSSLHNYPNVLRPLILWFRRRFAIVADVRDQLLSISRLRQLNFYSALIVCSENVKAHIGTSSVLASKMIHIPVIQEHLTNDRPNVSQTLVKYNLQKQGYLLFAGLIKQSKGVDLLLDTFSELRDRGFGAELVLAGFSKDEKLMSKAMNMPNVRVIGAVPREELLDIISAALMNVNVSESEGMPRASLESLALGVPVLLPSGIPEFEKYCAESVVRSDNARDVADQIESLLVDEQRKLNYPIAFHEHGAVVKHYLQFFKSIIANFKSGKLM